MAAPPAKRQRKLIVLSSSDNEAESKTDRISSVAATGPDYNQKQNKLSYSGSAAQAVDDRDSSSSEHASKKPKKTSDTYKGSEKNTCATTTRRRQKGLKEEGSLTTTTSLSPDEKKKTTTKSKKSGTGVVAANGNTAQKSKQQQQQQRRRQDSTTQSLHNFFQPATDEQRWSFSKSDLGTRQTSSFAEQLEDDLIEDDWFDADALLESAVYSSKTLLTNDLKGQKAQKDRLGNGAGATVIPIQSKGILRPVSKRFILDVDDESGRAPEETGQKPWSEQYPPTLMDQLAVHKKKVADVRDWLHSALSGRSRRHKILVLHGPAGCGKTATVSLLSNELGFDIVDWRNPFGTDTGGGQYSSLNPQFDDFLSQLNGFGGLDLSDSSSTTRTQAQSTSQAARKRVILIEEFPANLSWGSAALSSFQNSLRQYLASGLSFAQRDIFRNSTDTTPPIVIIISETMLNSSGSTSDNLTTHRLLGPEVYSHPAATTIEFNPIAPTFMLKALQLILQKEASRSKRQWIPGIEVLKRLSELGDIRSAVSALEFLCLRNDKTSPEWSGRVAWKSSKTTAPLTAMERESLELITQRESSLGLFHAVGKVVYNKRDDAQDVRQQDTHVAPPSHLRHLDRPKVSQVFVADMMDRTGTDVHTFTAALHENYPPSCDGMNFTETLEGCIEFLSDSDILGSETRSYLSNSRNGVGTARGRFLGYGASVDRLRQDEISFQVAVRGLLFSLPYPVRRRVDARLSSSSSTKGKRVGPFKLYYPTSQRLWKEVEEIEGLVTLWERQLLMNPSGVKQMNGDTNNRLAGARDEGVASWKMNAMNVNANLNTTAKRHDSHELHMPSLVSREDMLLHYLPYLAKIVGESPVASAQRLTRITRFEGLAVPPEDDDLVGDNSIMPEEANATRIRAVDSDGVVQRREEEHLFLSDDDIED